MKRYILLGIGIGIIFTNIVLSFVHGNKVDIDKIVEAEVQKRLKNIETYQKVEESFKEVVKDSEKNEEKLLEEVEPVLVTSEAISEEVEKEVEAEKKKFFSGDKGKSATNYIFIYHTTVEKSLLKIKKDLSELLDTKIELRGDKAYLFSKYPYNSQNAKEILSIIKNDYNLKVKVTTLPDIERLLNPPPVKDVIKPEENKKVKQEETKVEVNGTATKETSLKKVEAEIVQKMEDVKESVQ